MNNRFGDHHHITNHEDYDDDCGEEEEDDDDEGFSDEDCEDDGDIHGDYHNDYLTMDMVCDDAAVDYQVELFAETLHRLDEQLFEKIGNFGIDLGVDILTGPGWSDGLRGDMIDLFREKLIEGEMEYTDCGDLDGIVSALRRLKRIMSSPEARIPIGMIICCDKMLDYFLAINTLINEEMRDGFPICVLPSDPEIEVPPIR